MGVQRPAAPRRRPGARPTPADHRGDLVGRQSVRRGLVSAAVPDDHLVGHVDALADAVAALDATAVRRMLGLARPVPDEAAWDREWATLTAHVTAQAAVRAGSTPPAETPEMIPSVHRAGPPEQIRHPYRPPNWSTRMRATRRTTVDTPDDLLALVGAELGVSAPQVVTQQQVDQFADVTGDHQWIHVDVARARVRARSAAPLVHGFLTLALDAPAARRNILEVRTLLAWGSTTAWTRFRFVRPLPPGCRDPGHRDAGLGDADRPGGGGVGRRGAGQGVDRGGVRRDVAALLRGGDPVPVPRLRPPAGAHPIAGRLLIRQGRRPGLTRWGRRPGLTRWAAGPGLTRWAAGRGSLGRRSGRRDGTGLGRTTAPARPSASGAPGRRRAG